MSEGQLYELAYLVLLLAVIILLRYQGLWRRFFNKGKKRDKRRGKDS